MEDYHILWVDRVHDPDQASDNPAASMTAQEIAQRVQLAQSQRTASQPAVAAA